MAASFFLLLLFIIDFKQKRVDCPYSIKQDCPYNKISKCPYDTTHCHAFHNNKKTTIRKYVFIALFVGALVLYFLALEKAEDKAIWKTIETISLSIISASVVAFLIDLPGKMKEYQSYFVDLLSSSEYLKHLDEDGLSNLRQRVTWLQHAQDYPNMPRELLRLDERICQMMRAPYFKRFSQIMLLSKKDKEITKTCVVEYTVNNPGSDGTSASVDIGLSTSVMFKSNALDKDEDLKKEAERIIKIKKFIAHIDGASSYDLTSHIRILVYKGKSDNSNYNGEIHIAPLKEYSNKLSPLNAQKLSSGKKQKSIPIDIAESNAIDLFIEFKKELIIKLEYEIIVPAEDKCFSKRLRYPVKYFHLDYTLQEGFDDTTLSGDLIGTLIDSKDISLFQSKDKKRLTFDTRSWMLPKNGVFIVHSN